MSIKTHTFATGKYSIDLDGVDGYCDNPAWCDGEKEIVINKRQTERNFFMTALHEGTHAELQELLLSLGMSHDEIEVVVTNFEKHVGSFIWRLGYRREK